MNTTSSGTTPGPWVLEKHRDGDEIFRIIRGDGGKAAVVSQSSWCDTPAMEARDDANWRIMTSAQQQADALRLILERAEGLRNALALVYGSGAVPAKLRRPLKAVADEVEAMRAVAEEVLR